MPGTLYITGDTTADGLLNADGTALLLGMLLDQQVPMEWAFAGPAKIHERLGHLDAARIAAMDVDDLFPSKPGDPLVELGRQDLDPLSVGELHERIEALKAEIARVEAHIERVTAQRSAAEELFKKS